MGSLKLLVVSLVGWGGGNLDGVVLDFSAPWCGPCQQMSPIVSKLERNGYPIRKVDLDSNRDLARRFNVSSIPAFVLVVDGVEKDRVVGACSEEQLKRLCARIPRPNEAHPSASEQAGNPSRSSPARPEAAPAPGPTCPVEDKPAPSKPGFRLPFFGDKKEEPSRNPPEVALSRGKIDQQASRPPVTGDPLAASVRIRVIDASGGIDVGSGTIIDSRVGVTTVLTCGHIFRYWNQRARIEVDYWRDGRMQTVDAHRLTHNLDDDVGLISMNVDPMASCRVVAAGAKILKGAPVVSVGCSGGDNPTVQNLKITALDRYLGADNIEVGGMPVQGRSGGGLFNQAGQVIGVCSGADAHHREGLYVGPKTIQALLDRCNLAHLYRPAGQGANRQQIAEQIAGSDEQPDLSPGESMPASDLGVADSRSGTRVPVHKALARKREPAPQADAGTDEGAIREALEQAGEAEIVCIIRPINQPRAASRVVILNRASRRFVAYLSDEADSQPNIRETTLSAKETPPGKPAETQSVKRPTTPSVGGGIPTQSVGAGKSEDETPRPLGPQPYKRKPAARPMVRANGQ